MSVISLGRPWKPRLNLGEKILIALSKEVVPAAAHAAAPEASLLSEEFGSISLQVENTLQPMNLLFPDLEDSVRGKSVVDFGSEWGHTAIALAALGAAEVMGCEVSNEKLQAARELADLHDQADRVSFKKYVLASDLGHFDVVISKEGFEHFPDPLEALAEMSSLVKEGGEIWVSFGPLWYSPNGHHMSFTSFPWINLLFSERTVMNVRALLTGENVSHYEMVPGGLNRMTLKKFHRLVGRSGLRIQYLQYVPVNGWSFLSRVPWLREFFTERVVCILKRD